MIETNTMTVANKSTEKLIEIQNELQKQTLWYSQVPNWVNQYPDKNLITETDFIHWLQFIFLPNKLNEAKKKPINLVNINIALQAKNFLGSNEKYQTLLNLLIELDSLSS